MKNSSKALIKSATSEKIKVMQNNLTNFRLQGQSREEYEASIGKLLQNESQDRQVAKCFQDRVKMFENDIQAKNKQAEDFVKKM